MNKNMMSDEMSLKYQNAKMEMDNLLSTHVVSLTKMIICMSFGWGLLTITRWFCSGVELGDPVLYRVMVAVVVSCVAFAIINALDEMFQSLSGSEPSGAGKAGARAGA